MKQPNDSAETPPIKRAVNSLLILAAVVFVGLYLASLMTVLQEIRDSIQDRNFVFETILIEIQDGKPQVSPKQPPARAPEDRPAFWRGT